MGRAGGILVFAIVVLAVIYGYNYFSSDGIAALGKPKAK